MMRGSSALALSLVAISCAASRTSNNDCDGGACVDAAPVEDAAPEIDAPPGRDFGEACTDNAQCESNLCILVGTSGQCTRTCGQCPLGYGCLGVDGISIDGEITFVCVPLSNQLCTPCAADSECTLLGMDKCVTYPDGDRACGRDCTTVGCPMGFTCEDVSIGGAPYRQCMAESGACDCTATNAGAMQQCNIPTPFNVCLGSQTCGGASGWGTCAPPSAADAPDAMYKDDNCDGIDGDITAGIFVSTSGSNGSTCGLVYTDPCATVSFGISRATATGRTHVYVQSGMYAETVVLASNIQVWGGYNVQWQRGPHTTAANRVTILGAQDNASGGAGEYLAVRAHDVTGAQMADLIIRGPTASGQSGTLGRDGRSSYAVHANNAQLVLTRVRIEAGNGAPAMVGPNGSDHTFVDAVAAMDGDQGQAGEQDGTACSTSRKGGGPAGTNSCNGTLVAAGNGGSGGARDSDCSCCIPDLDATNGNAGGAGSSTAGSGGGTCTGGSPPGTGGRGSVSNGAGGSAVNGGYLQSSLYWYARTGGAGSAGAANGGGGGGGGGAGGCDSGTDTMGAGGGGGGAGGCRAANGGAGGGGGGGGSFGVFVVGSSTVNITGCELVRGTAASGGAGGIGGRGQSGGRGGPGGLAGPNTRAGGTGGDGGHGGHGGGGAGGQGGRSVGVVNLPGATVTHDCSVNGGASGAGGSGGASAPSAPIAERDGNSGANGASGTLETSRTCTSTSSC